MMMAGSMELLVLLFIGQGITSSDLVSLIDARDYFQARSVEVKADRMAALASRGGKDPKAQIAQLLAIRWLGEHPREVKAAAGAREVLEQVAAGKKGKDPLGFARDYARRALARLDGKPTPVETLPADSLRRDALDWFPAKSSIFGGVDLRPPAAVKSDLEGSMRALIGQIMPAREKGQMYDFADQVGNIRIDRISFAVIPDANQADRSRIFFRFTGRGDARRISAFLRKQNPKVTPEERKAASGEPVTVLRLGSDYEPAMAFVGNTDFLMCGFTGRATPEAHVGVLGEALQVMDGKKASVLKGPYAGTLKNSPARANGLAIGDLPDAWRTELTSHGSPFKAFPKSFNVSLVRKGKGLDIHFTGSAASAAEARDFVASVKSLKQMGEGGLDFLASNLKVKANAVETLKGTLKGIKVEAQDTLLTGSARVSDEAVRAVEDVVKTVANQKLRVKGAAPPPPPPQAKP